MRWEREESNTVQTTNMHSTTLHTRQTTTNTILIDRNTTRSKQDDGDLRLPIDWGFDRQPFPFWNEHLHESIEATFIFTGKHCNRRNYTSS